MTLIYPVSSVSAHPPRLSPAYKSTVKRSPTRPRRPGSGNAAYRLDIHLQGDRETVFFDV